MADVTVVNASPLITLANIGRLDILDRLCPGWLVPAGVVAEVAAGPVQDQAMAQVSALPDERIRTVAIPPLVQAWDFHTGESEVIALCLNIEGAEAILDDRAARRGAAALDIRACGTVGLLVRARRVGIVANLRTELDAVRKLGLRVDDALIQRALVLAGEAPR